MARSSGVLDEACFFLSWFESRSLYNLPATSVTEGVCMRRFAGIILVLLANLVFGLVAVAQTGSITGSVVDSQGAAVVGARVQAFDQAKGIVVRETTSGADGIFTLQPLLPGAYTVRINAKGMRELVRSDLALDQNQVLGIGTLAMTVGAATETVTVGPLQRRH
jgi:hypothetical protein